MLLLDDLGAIAQSVERQVEALCVGGSIPPCAMALWWINRAGTLSDTNIRYELDNGQDTMKFVSKHLQLYSDMGLWQGDYSYPSSDVVQVSARR